MAMAEVFDVLEFSELNSAIVKKILVKYGAQDGIEKKEISKYYELFKDKNYCLLIFLRNPKRIIPFEIDKKGFGLMSAWITVNNISQIKK